LRSGDKNISHRVPQGACLFHCLVIFLPLFKTTARAPLFQPHEHIKVLPSHLHAVIAVLFWTFLAVPGGNRSRYHYVKAFEAVPDQGLEPYGDVDDLRSMGAYLFALVIGLCVSYTFMD
jgi:hypothetical protein